MHPQPPLPPQTYPAAGIPGIPGTTYRTQAQPLHERLDAIEETLDDVVAHLADDDTLDNLNPDVLRAAKRGLMASLAAESPREFLVACWQSCSPMLQIGAARGMMDSLRSFARGAGTVADGLLDEVDPAVLVSIAEALGIKGEQLDPIKAWATDASARRAAEKMADRVRCGTVGCVPYGSPSAGILRGVDPDGVTVITPHTTAQEYADRTEVTVSLRGADPSKVSCTKSDDGFFVEAPTSLPIVEFLPLHGGVGLPTGVLKYRGTIHTHGGHCTATALTGEPVARWDAASESLVLTFARQNVQPVVIEVPPPAGGRDNRHAEMAAFVMRFADVVGFATPNGTASDAEAKSLELLAYLVSLDERGMLAALDDVTARMLAAHPERAAEVNAVRDRYLTATDVPPAV